MQGIRHIGVNCQIPAAPTPPQSCALRKREEMVQGWSAGVGLLVEGTSLSLVAQAPSERAPLAALVELARQKYLYLNRTVPSTA